MSVRRTYDYDSSTKLHRERATADVEHIVEDALVHKNAGNNGWSKERTFRKIGSIPMHLLNEAFNQGINPLDGSEDAKKWVTRFLQDNPKFMTVDRLKTNKAGIIK